MAAPQTEAFPRLGRYQVINKIASGGMAEVFLARATGAMGFQRLVAVKLIHANFTRDTEFVKMFIDEARISMHLHHRNIVQVFDLDKVGDTYFIAMEFVHGVNLYDVYERIASKNRWIESPMALYLVSEISKGLHFAHTRTGPDGKPFGIVHRDISPQNVLLSFEGEVKITDFGIATAAERLHQTAAGIVKGKYAYMAPERLQEQPTDARVDVFSVGVLLYELLCGENPFAGPSAVETIENVLEKEIPPPSERGARCGHRLDEICLKALARDPNQRYRSGQALADAVTEYAMELTHARKDMAAGDQAVANLLVELFPEKAKNPPGAGDPKAFSLPGVKEPPKGNGGIKVSTIDTNPDPTGPDRPTPPDFVETQDSLARDVIRAAAHDGEEDYDAPTLMKMSPLDVTSPQLIDYDEPGTQKSHPSIASDDSGVVTIPPGSDMGGRRRDSNLNTIDTPRDSSTGPTEIPIGNKESDPTLLGGMQVAGFQLVRNSAQSEDPYGRTTPSQSGLKTIEEPMEMQHERERAAPLPRIATHSQPGTPRSNPNNNPLVAPRGAYSSAVNSGGYEASSSEQLVVPIQSGDLATPPKRSILNYMAGAMLALAVAVVAVTAVVLRGGETSLVQIPVQVTSKPTGAKVSVSGSSEVHYTPAALNLIAGQEVKLVLTLEGYDPVERVITPIEGTTPVINLNLKAVSGAITVSPMPPEAEVLIDGMPKPGTGKRQIVGLPLSKPMTVTFQADGYESMSVLTKLTEDRPVVTVPGALQKLTGKAPRPGQAKVPVQVSLASGWAYLSYEGSQKETPVNLQLPPGPVELLLKTVEGQERKLNVLVPASGGRIVIDD